MKLHTLTISALLTLATIVHAPGIAWSQDAFKTPTHPTLSELNTSSAAQRPAPSQAASAQFKTPTHPTLVELKATPAATRPVSGSVAMMALNTHPSLADSYWIVPGN